MAVCRAACSRSKRRAPWSKLDKVLLALTVTGFALSAIFTVTVLRMSVRRHRDYEYHMLGPHHHRHHGHHGGPPTLPPGMEETDCQIEDINDQQSEVECARNERGEWCEARPPPPPGHVQRRDADSHEERDRMRPKHHGGPDRRQHGEDGPKHQEHDGDEEEAREPELPPMGVQQDPSRQTRRHFPCMRMRVQMQLRERRLEAMAHQNLSEATNFPGCSFSSCEEDPDVNRERMEEMRHFWHHERHHPTRCLVNRDNPGHVIILMSHLDKRAFITSCGFQLTFWAFVLGMVFFVTLTIRRCRSKKTEAKRVNPEKLPGGAYLVTNVPTDGMSDKEKEAFGLSAPVVSNSPVPQVPGAPKEFLMLAPPAYDMKSADMHVQPPAYDAAPELQV